MKFILVVCLATIFRAHDVSAIVGGSNHNIQQANYIASYRVRGQHACSAILLNFNKAVTAAHCGGGALSDLSILAGTGDLTQPGCPACSIRGLLSFHRHPDYIGNPAVGYPNDVATITFDFVLPGVNVGFVALAASGDGAFVGATCTMTGWGRTCGTCNLATDLQGAQTAVISHEDCAAVWGSFRINEVHVCAKSPTNQTTSCAGDDGGPLVCPGPTGNVLVGINSWGEGACTTSIPYIFSRVTHFRSWIDSN